MLRSGRVDVFWAMLLLQLSVLVGCNSGQVPVQQPEFDPAEASRQAMELYDRDHNGELSEQELAACPGILMNRSLYDTDSSGSVSGQEIEERLSSLQKSRVGLTGLTIEVRQNGRPMRGAEVKLIPEAYFGPNVKPASGKTSQRGLAMMHVADEDLPDSDKGLKGVHYGTYKVVVTHPTTQIPAKYNTQTTLGYETQRGNPDFRVELKN